MDSGMFNGVIEGLIIFCISIGFLFWGLWELIDWLFIEEVIQSRKLITPELKITVKDNVIDTLYIYKK